MYTHKHLIMAIVILIIIIIDIIITIIISGSEVRREAAGLQAPALLGRGRPRRLERPGFYTK